uniref:Uncharacterized protein n=1 Tax=Trichobilharzia regenti TaxID=157069 RepID=A0AA85JAV6_TRIRE|nr:unnamed protein product [Trichobilharzia regenti]
MKAPRMRRLKEKARCLSLWERNKVLKLYEAGKDIEFIANHVGRGTATVRRIISGTWRPKRSNVTIMDLIKERRMLRKVKANRNKILKKLRLARSDSASHRSDEDENSMRYSLRSSVRLTRSQDVSESENKDNPSSTGLAELFPRCESGKPPSVHDVIAFLCSKEVRSKCKTWWPKCEDEKDSDTDDPASKCWLIRLSD